MIKYYIVAEIDVRPNGEDGDSLNHYEGTDFEAAKKSLSETMIICEKYCLGKSRAEGRILLLPDDVDLNDEDSLNDAICDAYMSYDTFEV